MTAQEIKRTKVFVSYSHHDREWMERLRIHLKPLETDMEIDVWDDSKIEPGKNWKQEIANAINATKIAVLLVSADFLASDFIRSGEVPPLLIAAQKDGAMIVPLILSASRFYQTRELSEFQSINDPNEPLADVTPSRREAILVQLANRIEGAFLDAALPEIAKKRSKTSQSARPATRREVQVKRDLSRLETVISEIRTKLQEQLQDEESVSIGLQIAETILSEGAIAVAQRTHPKRLAHSLLETLKVASAEIGERAKPLKAVSSFLEFQTRDSAIANIITYAVEQVGKDGPIDVVEGRLETSLEIVNGTQFDRGYLASEFITDREKRRVLIRNPHILLHEGRLSSAQNILAVMGKLTAAGKKGLVIVAGDVEEEALTTLIDNSELNTLAVKAPGFGDRRIAILEDLAILTGGKVYWKEDSWQLSDLDLSDLGRAERVIADSDNTTIVDGKGLMGQIEQRVNEIKKAIEETTSDYDREKLEERKAKLASGVAVIRVGGGNEVERKRTLNAIERAIQLLRAASSGVVPAENLALANASAYLRTLKLSGEQETANSILAQAMETPLMRMAEGLGRNGEETLETIRANQKQKKNRNIGYFSDDDSFVDLVKAGATVPALTIKQILETSTTLAAGKLASFRYTDDFVRQFSAPE
jgi:chaperonin GroEL